MVWGIKIRDFTFCFAFLLPQSLIMCSSRDIHAIISYCLVSLLVVNALRSRAVGRVGGS